MVLVVVKGNDDVVIVAVHMPIGPRAMLMGPTMATAVSRGIRQCVTIGPSRPSRPTMASLSWDVAMVQLLMLWFDCFCFAFDHLLLCFILAVGMHARSVSIPNSNMRKRKEVPDRLASVSLTIARKSLDDAVGARRTTDRGDVVTIADSQ